MYHMMAVRVSHVISQHFRVLRVGALSGPERGQNLMPVPLKKKLELEKDGLQQHLGPRVMPAQLQEDH